MQTENHGHGVSKGPARSTASSGPSIYRIGIDRFHQTLAVCSAWHRAHGHLPDDQSDDLAEQSLGRWLTSALRAAAKSELPTSQRETLEMFLRGWAANDACFERELTGCCAWVVFHHRFPRRNSPDQEEARQALWITNRRTDRLLGRLPRAQENALDAALPGWLGALPGQVM